MAVESYQLRFRHASGDIGPAPFVDTTTFEDIRKWLVQEWPKEGLLAKDVPASAADIRLILSGKFVEPSKALKEYKRDFIGAGAEVKPDTIVTLHMVLRPSAGTAPPPGSAKQEKEVQQKGCGCIIS